jgi:hypothetical protein
MLVSSRSVSRPTNLVKLFKSAESTSVVMSTIPIVVDTITALCGVSNRYTMANATAPRISPLNQVTQIVRMSSPNYRQFTIQTTKLVTKIDAALARIVEKSIATRKRNDHYSVSRVITVSPR